MRCTDEPSPPLKKPPRGKEEERGKVGMPCMGIMSARHARLWLFSTPFLSQNCMKNQAVSSLMNLQQCSTQINMNDYSPGWQKVGPS